MVIDSASNKKIKLMESLRLRKHREREGLFRIEGVRLAEMAAESGWEQRFGLYTAELLEKERGRQLLAGLRERCPLYEISAPLGKKVAATDTPQGIFLAAVQQKTDLSELAGVVQSGRKQDGAEQPLFVVLDGVQDPGNAGTIIRTADAVGATAVILTKGSVDVFGDKVVRGRQRRAGRLAGNRRGRPAGKAAAIAGWQGEWLRYPCRSRRSYCSCCSW